MWQGTYDYYANTFKDVFIQFPVVVINDTTVVANYDTLIWNQSRGCFYRSLGYGYNGLEDNEHLYYNINNDSMSYGLQMYSYKSQLLSVYAGWYIPNPSLKNYLPGIVGTQVLSGKDSVVLDGNSTNAFDSTYTTTTLINFWTANDSTIIFDKTFLATPDSALHYRCTDLVARTIIFQSFHQEDPEASFCLSTLIYHYDTKQIFFSQQGHFVDSNILHTFKVTYTN